MAENFFITLILLHWFCYIDFKIFIIRCNSLEMLMGSDIQPWSSAVGVAPGCTVGLSLMERLPGDVLNAIGSPAGRVNQLPISPQSIYGGGSSQGDVTQGNIIPVVIFPFLSFHFFLACLLAFFLSSTFGLGLGLTLLTHNSGFKWLPGKKRVHDVCNYMESLLKIVLKIMWG